MTTQQPNTHETSELGQILAQQLAVYAQIEEGLARKKKVLIENKADDLIQLDQLLVAYGQAATQLEQQRLNCLTAMGFEDQSLQQVIAQYPQPQRLSLSRTRDELKSKLNHIQRLNQEVASLLELSIRWVSGTVEMIAKAIVPEATEGYTSTGQKKKAFSPGATHAIQPSTIQRDA